MGAVRLPGSLVFQIFEPLGDLLPASFGLDGLTRCLASKHLDRLIEGFPIMLIQVFVNDLFSEFRRHLR